MSVSKIRTDYFSWSWLSLIVFFVLSACGNRNETREEWIPLFNGRDLSGWKIKIAGHELGDNYKNTFRVEDGMLRIAYDQYQTFDDKFGHLYYETPYSYYKLRFQYRFTGNQTPGGADWNVRNSGVMIHCQSAESVEIGQDFPVSLEVQLLGGLGQGSRTTANLCTPGTQAYFRDTLNTNHCISSRSKTYEGDQWVNVLVEVFGDSLVRHIVEGDTVLEYTKPIIGGGFVSETHNWQAAHIENFQYWLDRDNTALKEGHIALQAESHPIDFRNIELLKLIAKEE